MACPFYWYNHHYACMKSEKDVNKEIAEYYFVAPQIVSAIKKREDYLCIFDSIYTKLVKHCVNMIERGDNEKAHILYRDTIQQLRTQYLV